MNETAPEPTQEDETVNGVHALALESTAIRQNFSQQALDHSHTLDLGNPNPFASVRWHELGVRSSRRGERARARSYLDK